ncbi:MAG: hypothetical protein IJ087_17900 [Eggerthellaceae bacterium]|nr:hypothetical protein [Eggerthellaceae bacterium]
MGENAIGGGGMGPADVAAVMRGNGYGDGWGGNSWWIVILFLAMMWGGNWGNNGFQNAIGYENLATSNEVQRGFDNQNSMANQRDILAAINGNSLQGMQNANQNAQYLMGMFTDKYNELQRDISGVAMMQQQTNFNQQQCCCDIKQAIQAEGNATRAMMQQNKIEALQQQVNDLNLQAQMAGVVRYPMSTSYNAGYNPFCNCNSFGM